MIDLIEAKNNAVLAVNTALKLSKELGNDKNVDKKERNDIVTDFDILIEREIINFLKNEYPTHFFSSEEAGSAEIIRNSTEDIYEWVIDPIDGTINFVAGIPLFSTSICLKCNDKIVVGIIYNHSTRGLYSAIKGKGSFCNDVPIRVSVNNELKDSILSFMLTSHYDEEQTDEILAIVRKLSLNTRGLRLFVSQAIELSMIASGKLDGTVCIKSRGFSSSAGSLLVQEAGGVVTAIDGSERNSQSTSLLVTNGKIHNEILDLLNN